MNISKYKAFLKTVEYGNITRAAIDLGYTQSGISHMIHDLEREYGFQLLIRSKSGVELTTNGTLLLKPLQELLNEYEKLCQTVNSINGLETGTIRIGTFTSVSVQWLPSIMKKFQCDFPQIEIQLFEGSYIEIEQWLEQGKIDCGFLTDSSHYKFDFIPLKKDRMLAILPVNHSFAEFERFPILQFQKEDFILAHKGFDDDVLNVFHKTGINPNIKYTVKGDNAIIAMVANELGIGMLPELFLQGNSHNICIKDLEPEYSRTIGIVVPNLSSIPPATKRFIDYLKIWLGNQYKGHERK
jgi:Transcriptional regulator